MSIENDLQKIERALAALEFEILDDGALGSYVGGRINATLKQLRIEAKTILDEALGIGNNFSFNLRPPLLSSPILDLVQETQAVVRGAITHISRSDYTTTVRAQMAKAQFVDTYRIVSLRSVNSKWDVTRLVRLCEELNLAYENDCFMSVAMICRAIMDHVPPIFDKKNFEDVASQCAGSSSFKKSMRSLQNSLRNIADAHLHVQIRKTEVLPTALQVDFHKDFDVLLGEIIRLLKMNANK